MLTQYPWEGDLVSVMFQMSSLRVCSGFIHANANTERFVTSKLFAPGQSCSVYAWGQIAEGCDWTELKTKSRFCDLRLYVECGITFRNLQCSQELCTPICTKAEQLLRQQWETSPAVPTSILGLLMLVAVAEFLIGLVGNGVFVVWSFREWLRTLRESLYNLIVLSLEVCWLLLQWLIVVDLSLFLLFQSSHWLLCLSVFRVLVSQASLWFVSFLSVCYCRKILTVNMQSPCGWSRGPVTWVAAASWCTSRSICNLQSGVA